MQPDPSRRRLYRAGAWAAAVYMVLLLVPMVLLGIAPLPPSPGAAVLEYIEAHGVVYPVELVRFVGLSVSALPDGEAVDAKLDEAPWPERGLDDVRVERAAALLGPVRN